MAFVIAAAATGTGPIYTQDLYRTRNDLADRGFTEAEISQAMALYSQWIDVARTGERWDDLERAMVAAKAEAKNEKWFDLLGLPQKKDYWLYKWYPAIGNFNPLPLWEKVSVPVLLVYGDRNTPVGPSLAGIGQALRKAGNPTTPPSSFRRRRTTLRSRGIQANPSFGGTSHRGIPSYRSPQVRSRFRGV